jgi:hypothetical protein
MTPKSLLQVFNNLTTSNPELLEYKTAVEFHQIIADFCKQDDELSFVGLYYCAPMDIYVAQFKDQPEDSEEFDTYYMVYSITPSGTICNDTMPPHYS